MSKPHKPRKKGPSSKPTKLRRLPQLPPDVAEACEKVKPNGHKQPTDRKGVPLEVILCDKVVIGLPEAIRVKKISIDQLSQETNIDKRIIKDMTRNYAVSSEIAAKVTAKVIEVLANGVDASELKDVVTDMDVQQYFDINGYVEPSPALGRVPSTEVNGA